MENNPSIKKTEFTGQLARYQQISTALRDFVMKQNLSATIKGNEYINVEGWQFLGSLLGFTAIILRVKDIGEGEHIQFRAEAELYNQQNEKIGYCTATCSNREKAKMYFDPYAIESMAQTRAIGKLYRLRLGFVAKMSGFEATPLEEMPNQATVPKKPQDDDNLYQAEQINFLRRQINQWLDNEEQRVWITTKNRESIAQVHWETISFNAAKKWYELVALNLDKASNKQLQKIRLLLDSPLFSAFEQELVLQDIDNIGKAIATNWITRLEAETKHRTEANARAEVYEDGYEDLTEDECLS
ncbi:hypothetical protein [uncultured Microscilla sp.]|uniref:hypothetical protein n=1 Tax=uncultured Microscilla sp. TaxID=432653 RepID=UPI00260B9459|nr:hypothetical protein [uncultured Microscilla sp.]